MKISLNWLKTYVRFDLSNDELKDLLTDIGLEVESMEPYESVKGGLQGLVVGHVLEREKHPDADKLSVCKVDVGTETLQIVCGAPNVAAGQKVIVALVGTTLYPTAGESFTIKKAKIRGVESIGMICAEDEIGIGTSHAGIMVLDAETPVAKPAAELFGVENDMVIEIGLTPNRTDAFSHIGVARDLAAALAFRKKTDTQVQLPTVATVPAGMPEPVSVEVQATTACPKYLGLVLRNVQVKESPDWLKNRLKAIGQKPINNVVDITNFVLHEFGQPLHAFDLSAIQGNKIIVRHLPSKTEFLALDNTKIALHEEDLMICDGNSNGMCIAGVYGGLHSGVQDTTKDVFLESAYFQPSSIRRTSTRHGLRTDAAVHFEKGIDPNRTEMALLRAAALLQEVAGAEIASSVITGSNTAFPPFPVTLEYRNVKRLTGADISKEDIRSILSLLEIGIVAENEDQLELQVPPYRTDVTREADVIEDILRIYGFNNVVIPTKINASLSFSNRFDAAALYNKTADLLVASGYFEMMNNSITKSKYQEKLPHLPADSWVRLLSSINVELDVMRNNMLFSGLESVAHNINHKNANVKLFEFGKTYTKSEENHHEKNHLAIFISGNRSAANWNTPLRKTDFYYLKSIVDSVLISNGLTQYVPAEKEVSEGFEYALSYQINGKEVATFGKVHPSLAKAMDIKQEVFFADINWDLVVKLAAKVNTRYKEIAKYPSVKRDLALLLDKKVQFEAVKSIAVKFGKKILRNIELFDIYQDEKIGADNKSYAVSFTFRDDDKTLQDAEIETVMKKLMQEFQTQLNAQIR